MDAELGVRFDSGSSSNRMRGSSTSARAAQRAAAAAGELLGIAPAEPGHADQVGTVSTRARSRFSAAANPQPEGDVVPDRHVRPQRIALEDHGRRPPLGRLVDHADAVDAHVAGVGLQEAADHAQRRGLAAAGRPEQTDELAIVDVEGQVADRRLADATVLLHEMVELQACHSAALEARRQVARQQKPPRDQQQDDRRRREQDGEDRTDGLGVVHHERIHEHGHRDDGR